MRTNYLLLLLFIFLSSHNLSATHIRGGYLSVEQVTPGSLTCKITLRMYLDIESGVPIGGSTDFLYFGDGSTRLVMPEIVQGTQIPGATWTMIDPVLKVALVKYTVEYTYPEYGSYKVSYMEVNRNQGIINLSNSVDTPFYTELHFMLAQGKQYKSPDFLTSPFFKGHAGVEFSYSVAATDANDYTLFYQLTTPKAGSHQDVQNYKLPENFKLNPFNGLITWDGLYTGLPIAGEYAIAVIVYQVRDNTIMGYTVLDFQVIQQDDVPSNGKLSDNKELNTNNRIFAPVNDSFSMKIYAENNQETEMTLEAFSALTATPDVFSFVTYDSTHETQKIKVGVLTLTNKEDIVRDNPYAIALRTVFTNTTTKTKQAKDESYLLYTKDNEITELPDVLKEHIVDGTEHELLLNAYPNPVKDFLNLENFSKPATTAALYDLHGKKVAEQNLRKENTTFDMRYLNAGYYLLKISYADGTGKIIRVIKP